MSPPGPGAAAKNLILPESHLADRLAAGGTRSMKRILVTGGCGFIGANFVRLQLETYPDVEITNLDALTYAGNPDNLEGLEDEPRYRFVQADVADRATVMEL